MFEDVPWEEIAPKAITIPYKVYKYRNVIRTAYVWAQAKLNKGESDVIVLGRPGVGKSMLLSRLTHADKNFDWMPPQASVRAEAHSLRIKNRSRLSRVLPGETSAERYQWINDAFTVDSKLRGIIYVADWGYTAERSDVVKQVFIKDQGITSVEDWRKINLEKEIQDFKIMIARIREFMILAKNKNLWLIILVNKTDLFMNDLMAAQRYYHPKGDGPFRDAIDGLLLDIGARFRVDAAPVCSWSENFEWNNEQVKTEAGGDKFVRSLLNNVLEKLGGLDDV